MQFSKFENRIHSVNAFNVSFLLVTYQVPLCLVAPGGKAKTAAQKGMVNTSGHTIHLMPGDHSYDTPTIPIVVVWNGINHYSPTYPIGSDTVLKWKLSLVGRHLQEAINIFGEIESDIDDQEDFDLCEQFHMLRDTAVQAKQLLGSSSVGIGQVVIPKVHIGPDPRDIQTSLTRSTILKENPAPMVRGGMSRTLESIVDVAEGANPNVPLVPGGQTSLTQCHSFPIPAVSERKIFPPPPKTTKPEDFSFPVGQFMEVKRKMGGKDLPPVTSAILVEQYTKTYDSRQRQSSTRGKQSEKAYDSGRAKGSGKKSKPELIVSIPIEGPIPPPQQPTPHPPVTSEIDVPSVVAAAVVAASVAASSSKSKGASKPQLIRCLQCKYKTFNRGDFNLHMDKHRGIRYICPEEGCDSDFGSTKAREQHFRTKHLNKARSECPFPDCDFSHNDHGVTKVHLYTDHGVGVEPMCRHPDCEGRDLFTNFRVYERHIKSYHQPKNEQCPHCNKKYKSVDHLRMHIDSSHKNEVTVQCDKCGKFYASKKTLNAHKKEHHKC